MSYHGDIAEHYTRGNLLAAIQDALAALGKSVEHVTIEDLAPVDEFHIGGRGASEHFLNQLNISPQDHFLDIGCGLGGAARFVASKYHNHVTGLDITPEYIEAGQQLCNWVGLAHKVTLRLGSAQDMPFQDEAFDGAYMMHVGMNIQDKTQLFKEIYRVLRPRTRFGIYDIMRIGDGTLTYPMPWATTSKSSHLGAPLQYEQALEQAGFVVTRRQDRQAFARSFFKEVRARNQANGGPPPLGLHTLIGESTQSKFQNMIKSIMVGNISPVEIIAQKN